MILCVRGAKIDKLVWIGFQIKQNRREAFAADVFPPSVKDHFGVRVFLGLVQASGHFRPVIVMLTDDVIA